MVPRRTHSWLTRPPRGPPPGHLLALQFSWIPGPPLGPPPGHLLAVPPGPSTSSTSTATGLAAAALPGPLDPVHPLHPLPPWGPWPLRHHPPGPLCPLQPVPMFGLPADPPPGPLPEATAQVQLVVCLMVVCLLNCCNSFWLFIVVEVRLLPADGAALTRPPLLCLWATSPPTLTLGATAPPPTLRKPSCGVGAARS